MKTKKYDISGLVCLWALAESGIGGVLHAFKLPFTGIFVGGFAILSIALIAWYSDDKKEILKALSIVLAVKLLASPHSPWQAYVAVAFQGLMGYLIFSHKKQFRFRTLVFAVICMLESALQKILLAFLIFGTAFFTALDKSALNVAQSLGLDLSTSLVTWVFAAYTLLHLATGIALGWWIPALPYAIDQIQETPQTDVVQAEPIPAKKPSTWIIWSLLFITAFGLIYFFMPEGMRFNLVTLLIRVIVITLALTFVIGPLLKMLILKYLSGNRKNNAVVENVLMRLPAFKAKMMQHYTFSRNNFKGFTALKIFILGMLVFSLKGEDAATS